MAKTVFIGLAVECGSMPSIQILFKRTMLTQFTEGFKMDPDDFYFFFTAEKTR